MQLASTRRRLHILVALWWWDERLLSGIVEFAHSHDWVLDARIRFTHRRPTRRTYDGAIIFAGRHPSISLLRDTSIPIVNLAQHHNFKSAPKVYCDDREIGRVAGAHLFERGCKQIGFVSFSDSNSSAKKARRAGLRAWCLAHHIPFSDFEFETLRTALPHIQKPLGLLVGNDELAVETITACQDYGFSVPDEIAILGVDDNDLFCRNASVPLSSVNLNLNRWGQEASTLLHGLIQGRRSLAGPVVIPPLGVSPRASTDIVNTANHYVAEALRYLRQHFLSPVTIASLIRHVRISRQSMQNLFLRHVGHSMSEELMRLRIEHAKQLMLHSNLKLDAVAAASGFTNRQHFHRTFQSKLGCPPGEWRKERIQ
ncbi:MAG: substrate-binding domain-containing protein [Verrucomicrobiota bacterium]